MEQALKSPITSGLEERDVVDRLARIGGYAPLFEAGFPKEAYPITVKTMAVAIAAYERTLVTPSRFDAYLAGDVAALSPVARAGLQTFIKTGCKGRADVTKDPADLYVFRVPSLRNVAMTAPYFHDGSVATLPDAVRVMARVQLGQKLSDPEINAIVAFLESLTGDLPAEFAAAPVLPPAAVPGAPH